MADTVATPVPISTNPAVPSAINTPTTATATLPPGLPSSTANSTFDPQTLSAAAMPPKTHRSRRHRQPLEPPGDAAHLSTSLTAAPDTDLQQVTTCAEIHHPPATHKRGTASGDIAQRNITPSPASNSQTAWSLRPQSQRHEPSTTTTTTSPTKDEVIPKIFSLLWESYHMHQSGTPVYDILSKLWPTISMLLTAIFA